uniref:Uncharacterized protein n=1 Tax=Acrobeloides nanus TaxID=290746 RepID=A0A914E335_9BILA
MNRFVQTLLLNLLIVDLYGEKDPFEQISTRPPPTHTTKNYEDRLKNFHRLSSVQNPRLPKSELKRGYKEILWNW